MGNSINLINCEDYVQSANTLFHFMQKEDYLFNAIETKLLYPRYCIEDISYLNLNFNGKSFDSIAVLQKCFCDIPIHQITRKFPLQPVDEGDKAFSEESSHPDFYGKYAIAFSKQWGTKNGLQPVHYVNPESYDTLSLKSYFEYLLSKEDIDPEIEDEMIERLVYLKPLRGTMTRNINGKNIAYIKNFHDEREWRYVPGKSISEKYDLERLFYQKDLKDEYVRISNNIASDRYAELALKFEIEDIRYIIVPDQESRNNLIKKIFDIKDLGMAEMDDNYVKMILISKILVLDQIEKDW